MPEDKIITGIKEEQEKIHWHVNKFFLKQARDTLRERGDGVHRRSE